MSLGFLEEMFGQGALDIVGDPLIIGVLVFIFFTVFVMFQNTRLDHKAAILVPAAFLSLAFAPIFTVLFGIGFGVVMYLAYTKFTSR